MLDKETMGPDHAYSPKREDYLRLHDHYTRMRPRAEAESTVQNRKWGVATSNPDPSESLAQQMSDD
jgi:hypothetical protein